MDDHPDYTFPENFHSNIIGTLSFEDINLAYKGYDLALNLNTIKNSQTMFARRVFELIASNTLVFSNFSRGIKTLFGDLIFCSDSGVEILEKYTSLTQKDKNTDNSLEVIPNKSDEIKASQEVDAPDKYEYAETVVEEEPLSLIEKEVEMIKKALIRSNGKRKSAAKELGISERTLYRKIKQFNLNENDE